MTDITEKLHSLIEKDRLPSGLLFVGSSAPLLRSSAHSLAQLLFCEKREVRKPCETCLPCKKVQAGHHPDLFFLETETKEIVIDQIRNLTRWLFIHPNEASRKIGIIEEAELLNIASSNALLKTLEEPPFHATIILLTRSTVSILPTIRSRLMLVRFPHHKELEDALLGEKPEWLDKLRFLLDFRADITPKDIFELTELIGKDRNQLIWFFRTIEKEIRERLSELHAKGNSKIRAGRLEYLFNLCIQTEIETIERYGNISLCLDHFLLEWVSPC